MAEETALASEPRLVELRDRLARERAAGAPFSEAWERVRVEALDGLSAFDRGNWMRVLAGTRWAWRAAYYRSPRGWTGLWVNSPTS